MTKNTTAGIMASKALPSETFDRQVLAEIVLSDEFEII
jgi:hypothetical protein